MDLERFGKSIQQLVRAHDAGPIHAGVVALSSGFFLGGFSVIISSQSPLLVGDCWNWLLSGNPIFLSPRGAMEKVVQGYLYFGFQMCVMLVTGFAFATSPLVEGAVRRASTYPSSARGAVAWVAFLACLSALMHWALGLIVGAMMAREVGRKCRDRQIRVHYPLHRCGRLHWTHGVGGGLSGSIPLKALSYLPPDSLKASFPYAEGIPETETLFGAMNGIVALGFLIGVPWVVSRLHPTGESPVREYAGEGDSLVGSRPDGKGLGWMKGWNGGEH